MARRDVGFEKEADFAFFVKKKRWRGIILKGMETVRGLDVGEGGIKNGEVDIGGL
jgi:hypothetical protein